MFKVGDRVVANGFLRVGEEDQLNRKAIKWVNDKTVLTVFDITEGANFSGDILCGTSNVAGSRFRYDKSELRYATEEEIAEADKKTASSSSPFASKSDFMKIWDFDGPIYKRWVEEFKKENPEEFKPEHFNITTNYRCEVDINVSNDGEHHVEFDTGDEGAGVVYLEPQEARATAKALCEHADYVDKMREKAKPKQPVLKIWKEGVKDEDGVVWLRLVRDPNMERNGITLRRVYCNGEYMLGGNILIIKDDGTLRRCTDCTIPAIQTAYGRIKEAE